MTTPSHSVPRYSREAVLSDYEKSLPSRSTSTDAVAALLATAATMANGRRSISVDVLSDVLATVEVDELVDTLARHGLNVDDLASRLVEVTRGKARGEFVDYDAALYTLAPERFDPTWTRPRVDGPRGVAVRGARRGYVVDSHGNRANYVDVLKRANRLLRECADEHVAHPRVPASYDFDLIGTDTYSWANVVTHSPFTAGTMTVPAGKSLVDRIDVPEHDVAVYERPAVVAGTGDPRKPRQYKLPRPSYGRQIALPRVDKHGNVVRNVDGSIRASYYRVATMPSAVVDVADWPRGNVRIVKSYATSYMGRTVVGHGKWQSPSKSTAGKSPRSSYVRKTARVVSPVVDVADFDTLVEVVAAKMLAAYDAGTTAQYRFRAPNGSVVTVRCEPSNRRYRAVVNRYDADGKVTTRATTTVRTVVALVAAVDRMVGRGD